MSHEALSESAASRRSQPESLAGGQSEDQVGKQIAPEKLLTPTVGTTGQPEAAAEGTAASFKPASANIDKFVDNESIGWGLRKDDLTKIIKSATKSNDTERGQVAKFLHDHFDDVRSLSATGDDRISREDLTLYSQMLKQSEKNLVAGRFAHSGLQDVHNQHENQAGAVLPTLGVIGGLYGSQKLYGIAVNNPIVAAHRLDMLLGNPRNYFIGASVARGAAWLTGAVIGGKVGGMIDRGMQDSTVRKHFVDEAEPAIKRLIQG